MGRLDIERRLGKAAGSWVQHTMHGEHITHTKHSLTKDLPVNHSLSLLRSQSLHAVLNNRLLLHRFPCPRIRMMMMIASH